MKPMILAKSRSGKRGSTLMVTVAVTALLGLSLATYLRLVNSQNLLVARSQIWNSCMPVVEAGIEEALTHCQKNYVTNMESNGWTFFNDTYVKSNRIGDGYYLTAISKTLPYEIVSRGYLTVPGGSGYLSRTVKVITAPQGVFMGGLIMRNTINLNGNNIRSDSYDSEDPAKSTNGKYDPTKAGDHGDIGSVGGVLDSVSIGNADVWGHVLTGPNGTVRVGPNGSAGNKQWHDAGNKSIQPGWWVRDMNLNFPDATSPFAAAPPPSGGTVNGQTYDYILSNGNYLLSSLSGKVLVTGDASLYVTGDVKFASGDLLQVATGGNLKLYVAGAETTINTVINETGKPASLTYFGLPTNKSVTMSGNSSLTAAIYAPGAVINLNGGVEFFGSVIARDATLNGHSSFHYDEALGRIPPLHAVVVTSWNEI
jgi:hypothetical protein